MESSSGLRTVLTTLHGTVPAAWQRALGVLGSSALLFSVCASSPAFGAAVYFERGDANVDGTLDLTDAIFSLGYLFSGGQQISCADAVDSNDDGRLDLSDPVFTLGYLFLGSREPPAPGGRCGYDPTGDDLFCLDYSLCAQPVEYFEVIDGYAVVEGDIVLGTPDEIPLRTDELDRSEGGGGTYATDEFGKRWPNGIVPYENSAPVPERVESAITHWENRTSVRFVQRTPLNEVDYPNYVSFETVTSGCYSMIGMVGGKQVVGLTMNCSRGNIIHEIGHAVGLWHEQSRPDRDMYITILSANIQPGMEDQFTIRPGIPCGPYDYGSIMHYPPDAFALPGCGCNTIETKPAGIPIGQRVELSGGDIWTIRYLYGEIHNACDCSASLARGDPPALGRPREPTSSGGSTPSPLAGSPDLVVSAFVVTGEMEFPLAGSFLVPVRITVENPGSVIADPFEVRVRLTGSEVSLPFLRPFGNEPETPVVCLPAGGATNIAGRIPFGDSFLGGNAVFEAVADGSGVIDESNEDNNVSAPISVDFPDHCEIIIVGGQRHRACF